MLFGGIGPNLGSRAQRVQVARCAGQSVKARFLVKPALFLVEGLGFLFFPDFLEKYFGLAERLSALDLRVVAPAGRR